MERILTSVWFGLLIVGVAVYSLYLLYTAGRFVETAAGAVVLLFAVILILRRPAKKTSRAYQLHRKSAEENSSVRPPTKPFKRSALGGD